MREPQYIQPSISKEDYFTLEAKLEVKHELWWGEMIAMAGAHPDHVTVAANAFRALDRGLDDTPCQAGIRDLRLGVDNAENYVYPDVVVWCEHAQWDETTPLPTLLTPLVIVEVLSRSTQLRDRREKLNAYRDLPSLRDYLMIAPDAVSVEHYARDENSDAWINHHYTQHAQSVQLTAFDLEIEVAQFYRRLSVPEELRAIAP